MHQNPLDAPINLGYNQSKNDVNEAVVEHYLAQPQIVKLDEQRPVHDTECKHETLVADPEDRIGDAIYHGCTNPRCGRGWYIL